MRLHENIHKLMSSQVQVLVPFQVSVLSVHYKKYYILSTYYKKYGYKFHDSLLKAKLISGNLIYNHTSCVHVHVQIALFPSLLAGSGFPGDDLTAVPYPCCDTPIKFMCMFRTVHRLKHMQTSSSRCLGYT